MQYYLLKWAFFKDFTIIGGMGSSCSHSATVYKFIFNLKICFIISVLDRKETDVEDNDQLMELATMCSLTPMVTHGKYNLLKMSLKNLRF
jgi:hypothetical protein